MLILIHYTQQKLMGGSHIHVTGTRILKYRYIMAFAMIPRKGGDTQWFFNRNNLISK